MTAPVPSFAEFFPFEAFEKFAENERAPDGSEADGGATYRKLAAETMEPALAKFIGAQFDAGRLKRLPGAEGRSGHIMSAWNGLFDDPANRGEHLGFLGHRFAHSFLFRKVLGVTDEFREYETDRAAYDALIASVDKGDLGWWNTQVEDYCFATGDRFHSQFVGWQLHLGTISKSEFLPMQPVAVPDIAETEIEIESGEVLVADWFKIDAFTAAAKRAEDPANDISSFLGCLRATQKYASAMNFLSVFVGNTVPHVFLDDGVVTVGRLDEDMEGTDPPEPRGRVCTDLWWATLIDRKRLVDIVADELGDEEAEAAVSAYLEEHSSVVTRLRMEPGTYRLYYSGDPGTFADRFHSPDLPIDAAVEPMLVLSPRPLELTEKPAAAPAP